ncbi:MAG: Endonuclease MutS2 [Catillopecten margaritatus gill symbiont]|uniref:Endonuclease MutS2 n=1 Tax=Catillopecten margaritatus gill symbiont TaxID=3083288 RepID=A0AAU6PFA3_9GAMM
MIDEKDKQLFRDTIDAIAPMDKDGGVRVSTNTERSPPFVAFSHVIDGTIDGEEVVSYAKSGISEKQMQIMKHGHIDSVTEIDLHGYTVEEACEVLPEFIYHHQFERYVRVIHGKGYRSPNGKSILKTQVVNFLRAHPQVLAFHSCPPNDGGTGATFALLKK